MHTGSYRTNPIVGSYWACIGLLHFWLYLRGESRMRAGDRVLWCGIDPATILSVEGEWATIHFDDTRTTTTVNLKHLEIV